LSSVIRAKSVTHLDRHGPASSSAPPRIFGARVLRSGTVGMERPVSLPVPASASAALEDQLFELGEASAPALDFEQIEEAARLQGYNVGYEEGHAAGLAAADQATSEQVRRLSALVRSAHETHSAFFRAAERQVVDLALQIAQKVVEREIENMPDLAVNIVRAALEEMDARTAVRVRVNPDDAELLRRRWSQVVPSGIGADRIELQPDERVTSGGAIIETTHGQVDAQLESKLAQLGNALWTFVMDVNSAAADVVIDA
jgi:flagellar assembly protein FliH